MADFNTFPRDNHHPIFPEGFTIINQPEKNNNAIVPDPSAHLVKDINAYFEVIGDLKRKCNLCSIEVRKNPKNGDRNLRYHIMTKHQTEWNLLIPFLKFRKPKVSFVGVRLTQRSQIKESDKNRRWLMSRHEISKCDFDLCDC